MAIVREREMKTRVEEMRARVVEAEAEVPKAIAVAFREGQLGVMDYYSPKNLQSDTEMRDSISAVSGPGGAFSEGPGRKRMTIESNRVISRDR